jgi:hypothetical protein
MKTLLRMAVISRCLYECYIAFDMKLGVVLQFGDQTERDFRAALSKGGIARINEVLDGIDATKAEATMRSDLQIILSEIEASMGLHVFNQKIREGILTEYRSLARQGLR